ncbi:hypothetical protein J7L01_00755, partial [bacterium]|nr:hypothetical protein [bacterium]
AMEEIFDCEYWADASTLIKIGAVFPTGTKRPDFVCGFKDGSLGIFEAKGTTGSTGNLAGALADGKLQTAAITAQTPITRRVAVGIALHGGTQPVTLVILDPPNGTGEATSPLRTNLTAAMVRAAAKAMRTAPFDKLRERPTGRPVAEPAEAAETPAQIETIFRGPRREIKLEREEYRADKRHGWLQFEA